MFRPKRQNALFLSGWIIAAEWVDHERLSEQVLAATIRSDRLKYGGHHTVYFRDDLALRLHAALSVFTATAPPNRYKNLEAIPFAQLDAFYLMVVVHGVLYFDDVFAVYLSCPNLTGSQRSRIDERLEEMRWKRSLAAMQPRRPVGQSARP